MGRGATGSRGRGDDILQCQIHWTVSAGVAGFYLVVTKYCAARTLDGSSEGEGWRDGIGGSQIARNVANQPRQLSSGNTTRAAARIFVIELY
ncbi:hypothetical protein FOFC_17090 [Fusarium oxysporum]|nr:hypothetical protein FOFC_17090 [Fusarium oxysporum]